MTICHTFHMPKCPYGLDHMLICPYAHMVRTVWLFKGAYKTNLKPRRDAYLLPYTYYVAHMPMWPLPACPSKSHLKTFMPYHTIWELPIRLYDLMTIWSGSYDRITHNCLGWGRGQPSPPQPDLAKFGFKAFMPYHTIWGLPICPYGLDRMTVYLHSSVCTCGHMPYAHIVCIVWYVMVWHIP